VRAFTASFDGHLPDSCMQGLAQGAGLLVMAAIAVAYFLGMRPSIAQKQPATPSRRRVGSTHARQAAGGPEREVQQARPSLHRTSGGQSDSPARERAPLRRSLGSQGAFGGGPSQTWTLRLTTGSPPRI